MSEKTKDWISYWDNETTTGAKHWQMNIKIFIASTEKMLGYHNSDVVLDIGCGPGYFERVLQGKVKRIDALDTSHRYIDACRNEFSEDENICFHLLDRDNYTDLSFLPPAYYSLIIFTNVIQYYRSVEEYENLIEQVQRVAAPGAKFLTTDIVTESNPIKDAIMMLGDSVRHGSFWKTMSLLVKMSLGDYRRTRAKCDLLTISEDRLNDLIKSHQLKAEIISERLTHVLNRKHLLIEF